MVLKTKLSLGLGFLFLIILALVVFSSLYIAKLSKDAANILKDNYNTIVYMKNMFVALDDMILPINSLMFDARKTGLSGSLLERFNNGKTEFENNLKNENSNITETHEKEYVGALNADYSVFLNLCKRLEKGSDDKSVYANEVLPVYLKIRLSIEKINEINMQAIERKNLLASKDSTDIIRIMAGIGAICVILAFGYFRYFPFYISNTISYLSDKMKDLLKKAGIKLSMNSNDEALILLQSINLLENKLNAKNRKS